METDRLLFSHLPEHRAPARRFPGGQFPVWTKNKSRLIQAYLRYFVLVTKHGAYIDGFAGPQRASELSLWSARSVVESRPRWLRTLILCERDSEQVKLLMHMLSQQPPKEKKEPKRECIVLAGDFNLRAEDALSAARIKDRTAAFCLLDQRTFECHWSTIERIARYKKSGTKIELFYFLPIGWLKRSLAAVRDPQILNNWWGSNSWEKLRTMDPTSIADLVSERFEKEFGYATAQAWPIRQSATSRKIMYFMIHATDHPHAPALMRRAYNKAVEPLEDLAQLDLEDIIKQK